MSPRTSLALLTALFLATPLALAGDKAASASKLTDKYYIVTITDHHDKETVQVLSDEEYKDKLEQVKKEEAAWTRAMMAAEKKWREDDLHKGKRFPRNAVHKMEVDKDGKTYRTMEEANEKLQKDREAEVKKAARKAELAKKYMTTKPKTYTTPEREEKKKAREAEKKALDDAAIRTFEMELSNAIAEAEAKKAEREQGVDNTAVKQ